MHFGESLNHLLNALDISINRLSKAINVDSSLVNRWIHGKRIPSYNTPYIDSISEYLSKNILNTYQEQRVKELLVKFGVESDFDSKLKDTIKIVLLEAQGYSLECKRHDISGKKESKEEEPIEKVNEYQDIKVLEDYYKEFNYEILLSDKDKIIIGNKNIHAETVKLLETIADKTSDSIVYLSFNNEFSFDNNNIEDMLHIRDILLKAVDNGWCVKFLVRLSNNLNRTIRIINYTKPLIKTGKVIPYYIKKYDIFTSGKECIIVPEMGAISSYSTTPLTGVNCAFYFSNIVAINILQDYFISILKTSAHPLVKYYSKENLCDYGCRLLKYEEYFGNRYLYEYGFSTLTLPKKLYYKLLCRIKPLKKDAILEYNFYIKRLKSFQKNIQTFEYKDIYSIESIDMLLNKQQMIFYTSMGIELVSLEITDIIELLKNLIAMLKKYDHYHIAFMHPKKDESDLKSDFCYYIKERQGVLFETFDDTQVKRELVLSIDEPLANTAFVAYFKEVWDHIAPTNKEKPEIINWLQSHINMLEKKIN